MQPRAFLSAGLFLVGGAVLLWTNGLQIATSEIPAKFSFADIKLLRADDKDIADATEQALEAYSRPLFAPDRRPFQVREEVGLEEEPAPPAMEEEEMPAVEVERPRLKLLGTVPVGQAPSALIAVEETGASSWFRKDDMVGSWRVSRIGTDDIELSSEGDASVRFNVSLYPESR